MKIILTNKGKPKLIVDGYAYHLERKKETYQWACAERKTLLCKGRVVTKEVEGEHVIKKGPSSHSHDPSAYDKSISEVNTNLKQAAKNSGLRPSQMIRNSVIECSAETRIYLPTNQAQEQKIKRIRRTGIKEPDSIRNINIPEELKYIEGEPFVLSIKDFGDQVVIVLATPSSLKLLADAECWLMDGTFDVIPVFMRQLFTIHGKIGTETVPLVFGIMSSKSEAAYFEFFYELCRWACNWEIKLNPKLVISDFEKASVKALKHFFPETNFKGCLFHFGQIIWRQVQKQGCAVKYGINENYSLQMRMLKSLAFLPAEEILGYYRELKLKFDPDARRIGKWFEINYLSGNPRKRLNIASRPQYLPNFWSIWDNFQKNLPTTQNSVEGWHRRLKVVVGKSHIGVYQLISELGKEYIMGKTKIAQMRAGVSKPIRRKLQIKNKKIFNIMNSRDTLGKVDYLQNIAYNLNLCK